MFVDTWINGCDGGIRVDAGVSSQAPYLQWLAPGAHIKYHQQNKMEYFILLF